MADSKSRTNRVVLPCTVSDSVLRIELFNQNAFLADDRIGGSDLRLSEVPQGQAQPGWAQLDTAGGLFCTVYRTVAGAAQPLLHGAAQPNTAGSSDGLFSWNLSSSSMPSDGGQRLGGSASGGDSAADKRAAALAAAERRQQNWRQGGVSKSPTRTFVAQRLYLCA